MLKKPIRIIDGTAKPFEPFWKLRNAEDSISGEPEIEFYGSISEYSWYDDDITPAKFKADLEQIGGGGPITIRIHSGGGDVFAASAIRAMIVDYPGRVTTRIDGLCASAATYVAMAGDRVVMQDSAFFMIHDPWTIAWGGVEELKKSINLLKSIKDGIIETYQNKTHLETDELARMMSAETWMTASQALEKGFVDEISGGVPESALKVENMAILNCLRNYAHVPVQLLLTGAAENEADESDWEDGTGKTDEENVTGEAMTSDVEPDADVTVKSSEDSDEDTETESTEERDPQEEEAQNLRDYLSIFGPRR